MENIRDFLDSAESVIGYLNHHEAEFRGGEYVAVPIRVLTRLRHARDLIIQINEDRKTAEFGQPSR